MIKSLALNHQMYIVPSLSLSTWNILYIALVILVHTLSHLSLQLMTFTLSVVGVSFALPGGGLYHICIFLFFCLISCFLCPVRWRVISVYLHYSVSIDVSFAPSCGGRYHICIFTSCFFGFIWCVFLLVVEPMFPIVTLIYRLQLLCFILSTCRLKGLILNMWAEPGIEPHGYLVEPILPMIALIHRLQLLWSILSTCSRVWRLCIYCGSSVWVPTDVIVCTATLLTLGFRSKLRTTRFSFGFQQPPQHHDSNKLGLLFPLSPRPANLVAPLRVYVVGSPAS